MFDGLSLSPSTLHQDGSGLAEVGVGGRHVAQALVRALVSLVLDEGLDLDLEVALLKTLAEFTTTVVEPVGG